VRKNGSKNVVYFDESGFVHHTHRPHAWALRGKQVFDNIIGNNRKNTKKGWQLTEAGHKEALREPAIYCRYLPEEAVAYYLNSVFRPEERGFIR